MATRPRVQADLRLHRSSGAGFPCGSRHPERPCPRGLTQAELATRIGVSRKTINTVEISVFVPSTILALNLARALDTSVEKLFHLIEG